MPGRRMNRPHIPSPPSPRSLGYLLDKTLGTHKLYHITHVTSKLNLPNLPNLPDRSHLIPSHPELPVPCAYLSQPFPLSAFKTRRYMHLPTDPPDPHLYTVLRVPNYAQALYCPPRETAQ